MKRLTILAIGMLLLTAALFTGCGGTDEPTQTTTTSPSVTEPTTTTTSTTTTTTGEPTTTGPVVSSCESCHTDQAMLQQTASEVVVEAPEEASGEG